MALLSIQNLSMGFGQPLLFEHVSLQIERGERICLLGRNGAGKSSLLKLINDDINPDEGQIIRQQGMRIALLPQEVPQGLSGTIFDVTASGLGTSGLGASGLGASGLGASGLGKDGGFVAEYRQVSSRFAGEEGGEALPGRLDNIQADRIQQALHLEALHLDEAWQVQVEMVISQMKLDSEARFDSLSAGLKRRALLARCLVRKPDVLLLDEPTNHLDIEAIGWLEDFLLRYGGTLLFVTHDRTFLRKLATRIVELDRGTLYNWACDYENFLERKQAALEAEAGQRAVFDKKLAQEEDWVRQGIKARRTRNEGRVRELEKMRETRLERREITGMVRMPVQETERSGKLVIEAKGLSYSYDERAIISDFSTTIMRGDRVGIIGPNGSGKTTLLRILLGELPAQRGNLRLGTKLSVAYFDQLRAQLDEEKSVMDNIGEGNDMISVNGRQRHVIGYLRDFLFSSDRAHSPVKILSGGERNRLLLARLFARPSNVLVMDEPTNDLDVETLELLEELLMDYSGTLLLVSHDRTFINNVVTSTLALEGEGRVSEYVGGYDDWLRQRKQEAAAARIKKTSPRAQKPGVQNGAQQAQPERPRKISYREKQELETLPHRIEILESEQRQLYQTMADPAFYKQGGAEIVKAQDRLKSLEDELDEVYKRWETLEDLNGQTSR